MLKEIAVIYQLTAEVRKISREVALFEKHISMLEPYEKIFLIFFFCRISKF